MKSKFSNVRLTIFAALIVGLATVVGCGTAGSEVSAESTSPFSAGAGECTDFGESCSASDNTISCNGRWGSMSMSCEDGESLTGCTYTESFTTVPDVCAGTPSSWEDEENIYTQTCVDGTECTSSEALATGNLSTLTAKDAGRGSVLGGINACYEKCKKGLHACLACWALAAAAAGGPGVKPVNPPNLPKVEQTKREMVKKILGGVIKKVAAGADAGATSK